MHRIRLAAPLFHNSWKGLGVRRSAPRGFQNAENILRQPAALFSGSPKIESNASSDPQDSELVTALVDSAASGSIETVRTLVVDKGTNVNASDYDYRSPLHLAAAEGQMEMCRFLVEELGANINSVDRFGNTPLADAVNSQHGELIKYFRSHGGSLDSQPFQANLCKYASVGDIDGIQRMIDAGVNISAGDYDGRTALHLAASEGQVKATELLLSSGADVNAADRFGNTPLQDAERGEGKDYRQVVQQLLEQGATSGSTKDRFSGVSLQTSIKASLPLLCQDGQWDFAEAWFPTTDGLEFISNGDVHYSKKVANSFDHTQVLDIRSNSEKSVMGRCFESEKPEVITSINHSDFGSYHDDAVKAGLKSGVCVPIMHDGKVVSLINFFRQADSSLERGSRASIFSDKGLDYFAQYAYGVVAAGVNGVTAPPIFPDMDDKHASQRASLYKAIVNEGVFNPNMVYSNVHWFFNMGFHEQYFRRYHDEALASHVHSYIAAKQFAATTGSPEDIWLHIENNKLLLGDGGPEQSLHMVPYEHRKVLAAERQICSRIAKIPNDHSISLEFFASANPLLASGDKRLALLALNSHKFPSLSGDVRPDGQSNETDIWKIATDDFLKDKPKIIRDRYQELLDESNSRVAPVSKIYETYHDGTIPIMFAFHHGDNSGPTADYILKSTELLKHHQLVPARKFVESFANQTIVFSIYLENCDHEKDGDRIRAFLRDYTMLHMVPNSNLTPLFLQGKLSPEKYTYASAMARCAYYFMNQRDEEHDALSKVLENDRLNQGRLVTLFNRLRTEAVSPERILQIVERYPELMHQLYHDFENRTTNNQIEGPKIPANDELASDIKKSTISDIDAQVLNTMLMLNRHIVKTNFYSSHKSAISWRLDPSFLEETSLPRVPFGMFFLMGADFQGFHIRFSDIARGGIRLIRSANEAAFAQNNKTLFHENYGLAYTQNLKNKDIPEFGSKGTILLLPGSQEKGFRAFKKYCSALLDLISEPRSDEISKMVDNYGKPELLFLGPDEGTADMMQWAAEYAKNRYPYWRSFTTGKPDILGGIPHDTYGMTTRSVHRYVVNCLDKLGMEESQVTKVQTGGPDGDLGSNEILISNDRTVAIIDGSGVIYDPEGLDRKELTRLAIERSMVCGFDASQLSGEGFKVMVEDQDVTLPNGELVENGLSFRNGFHLHPLCTADLFVPCGGRPESVNLQNVKNLIDAKTGKPKFKIVCEGANLFFTQDARMVLEDAGVVLYKDASTNKGGVTSSSLEVLAALALDEDQFMEHMSVQDSTNPPKFYMDYVNDIQNKIEADADYEFACIWLEHLRTGKHRFVLTDDVSDKINDMNHFIAESDLYQNDRIKRNVLSLAIPDKLLELVGLEQCIQRVPDAYLKSIFATYLASRYIYENGLASNEFAFFKFMQQFSQE